MDRRLFLARLLQTSGAALLAGCDGSSEEGAPDETILVVGAGIAGLAAARDLSALGLRVTVLEARDRVGGRIWTDRSIKDAPLDLGASWIHESVGNPLTDIASQLGVATSPTNYDDDTIYRADGTELTAAEQTALDSRADALLNALGAILSARQAAGDPDISIAAAIDQVIADGALGALTPNQKSELDFWVNTTIEHEEAAGVGDLSLFSGFGGVPGSNIGADGVGDGGDLLMVGGYDRIIDDLSKGLSIQLGQVVKRIERSGSGVTITTNKGVFTGDRAVITLPLGVLKSGSVEFSPPLPASKTDAMDHLGMSVLDKVYLRFATTFWDDVSVLGYINDKPGYWAESYNFQKLTGQKTLLCFNAGDAGLDVEAMSDSEIVASAMAFLKAIYGQAIPEPESYLITRWGADPYARGSYSHVRPGGGDADLDALAEPVDERLFFAGEATSKGDAATVQGAYLSGTREAARIGDLVGAPALVQARAALHDAASALQGQGRADRSRRRRRR